MWSWLAIVAVANVSGLVARGASPSVFTYTTDEGLPDLFTEGISRAPSGHLYLATQAGVVTFDGRRWSEPDWLAKVPSKYANVVSIDADGAVWVGFQDAGVAALTAKKERLTLDVTAGLPSNEVHAIAAHGGGHYLGTSAGLVFHDGSVVRRVPLPCGSCGVSALLADSSGVLVGTQVGLFRLAADANEATAIAGLVDPRITALARSGQTLAVGTEAGVSFVGPSRTTSLSGMGQPQVKALIAANGLWGAEFFVGTYGGGVWSTDGVTATPLLAELSHVKTLLLQARGERAAVLWVGHEEGVSAVGSGPWLHLAPAKRILSVVTHPNRQALVFSHQDGVSEWSSGRYRTLLKASRTGDVFRLTSARGRLIAGSQTGAVYEWNGSDFKQSLLLRGKREAAIYDVSPALTSGECDYFATRAGLFCARGVSVEKIQHFGDDEVFAVEHVPTADGKSRLFAAQASGLFELTETGWQEVLGPGGAPIKQINDIAVAADGSTWLGTLGAGALMRRKPSDEWQSFSTRSTVPIGNDTVNAISFDADGTAYLCTNRGITQLRYEEDWRARHYLVDDGLPANECMWQSLVTDARGVVWAGTSQGLAALDAASNVADREPKPLFVSRAVVESTGLELLPGTVLSHKDASVSFELTLLSFHRASENRYQTRLLGLETLPPKWSEEWRRSYPGLAEGNYTLEVSAKDYAGNVSGPVEMAFSVRPPPWRTWWAYSAYFLGAALSVVAGFSVRTRQLRQRAEALEATVLKRTEEVRAQSAEILQQKNELEASYKEADRIFEALKQVLKGSLIDGRYQLADELGQGGFGVVYRAVEVRTGKDFAIKVFRPQSGNDSGEALERFKIEGKSGVSFRHPNAIHIIDFGISKENVAYMVMELLNGTPLSKEIQRVGKLPLQRAIEISIRVCQALAAAHARGIIHRDIKPENVFLHQDERGETVKVLDFGVAKLTQPTGSMAIKTLTMTGAVVGTPTYMAPERLESEDYDGRSDVYSVGIMLYEMLAGRPPFVSNGNVFSVIMAHLNSAPEPVTNFTADVPETIQALITRSLSKVPAERPTALELANALLAIYPLP